MKGLLNFGNSCYFNAAIQCICQIPVLSNYFILNKYKGSCPFILELRDIIKLMWIDKSEIIINHNKLFILFKKRYKQFDNYLQHDVQEAIICILDILDNDIPLIKEEMYANVDKLVVYPNGKSITTEKYLIHFIYPTDTHKTISETVQLMQDWSSVTDYEDDTKKIWPIAAVRSTIVNNPKVIILSLGYRNNISLDENIYINNNKYSLISTAVHIGGERSGHYASFGKHRGKWYLKDDDKISLQNPPMHGWCHYVTIYYRNS